jgi:hypothetical protein
MNHRERNPRLTLLFALCGACIAAVTWTISEKFIAHAVLALAVNAVAGVVVALLFKRYLETKLAESVEFLAGKVGQVGRGDLTQRFKEDPEDILPSGLAYNLGEMMKFLRENVGGLWKVASALTRELGQFIASTEEALKEFRDEIESLGGVGHDLESVRREAMETVKNVSALKVNAGNDIGILEKVNTAFRSVPEEVERNRSALKRLSADIEYLQGTVANIRNFLANFSELSAKLGSVEKSLADLRTESNVVTLNAAIDSTRERGDDSTAATLVAEAGELAKRVAAITQESRSTLGQSGGTVKELVEKLNDGAESMRKNLDALRRSHAQLGVAGEKSVSVASNYSIVYDHVGNLAGLVGTMDKTALNFSRIVRQSTDSFDKLHSDAQITLVRFNELETKIGTIQEKLRHLEEFKKQFTIG